MVPNQTGKPSRTGQQRTNKPTTLVIRLARAGARLVDADGTANALPVRFKLAAATIDSNDTSDTAIPTNFMS